MSNNASKTGAQGAGDDFGFYADAPDLRVKGPEYGDPYCDDIVVKAIRAVLTDKRLPCLLDSDTAGNTRAARGVYALKAVLEFLVEDHGFKTREAMDTLVLEAVRQSKNFEHAANLKYIAAREAAKAVKS
jgi:hypothetical protein